MEWDPNVAARLFSDAAVGVKSWQSSLDEICELFGAAGATLLPLNGQLAQMPTSQSFEEAIGTYLKQGWHQQDVRFRGLPTARKRGFVTDLDFITESEIDRSPYYQDWLRP